MGEENNKSQKEERPRRFNQQQYDLLKRCSDKKDLTEWNKYRRANLGIYLELEGANFDGFYLSGAFLHGAHLKEAILKNAHLEEANLEGACLERAILDFAHLNGANFDCACFEGAMFGWAHLERAKFRWAILEGAKIWKCHLEGSDFSNSFVNSETQIFYCRIDKKTDFRDVAIDNIRIESVKKQLLKYNTRRMNWEDWYKEHPNLKWIVKPFWWVSDYGLSTGRIIAVFVGFVIVFSCIYYVCGKITPPGIVDYLFVDGNGVKVTGWLVPIRAIHFSVVVMTVGFTNMHANAHSFWAHVLVGLQMILGFVLLGALVTRFAVLFTAGGPAGKFADEKKKENTDKGNDEVS